jgi:phytanoyl-CoA hydroxylase
VSQVAHIPDGALEAFARDGFAPLGRVADDATLAALRARVDDLMLGRVVIPGLFFQHDSPTGAYEDLTYGKGWVGPSLAYRKLEKLEMDDVVRAWIENPLFGAIAHTLVGPDVSLYRAMLMNKAAQGGTALPWHQDGGTFWGIDRQPTLQIWTALDDCPEDAGCLEFVPGSHARGLCRPEGGTVEAKYLARFEASHRAVHMPCRAGDAFLIHNHVFHRSSRNATGAPRRALSFCYMDAATRCLRQKRAPRVFTRLFRGHSPG